MSSLFLLYLVGNTPSYRFRRQHHSRGPTIASMSSSTDASMTPRAAPLASLPYEPLDTSTACSSRCHQPLMKVSIASVAPHADLSPLGQLPPTSPPCAAPVSSTAYNFTSTSMACSCRRRRPPRELSLALPHGRHRHSPYRISPFANPRPPRTPSRSRSHSLPASDDSICIRRRTHRRRLVDADWPSWPGLTPPAEKERKRVG